MEDYPLLEWFRTDIFRFIREEHWGYPVQVFDFTVGECVLLQKELFNV